MCYALIRSILFCLPPEIAHAVALSALQVVHRLRLIKRSHLKRKKSETIMGLPFTGRLGLAAGLDKNGDYIDALAALPFDFIEVGTVTPKPQPGNPKPRLFRLPHDEALINRMGFNNNGLDYLIKNLKKIQYKGILGINIGKNADTPQDRAIEDYLIGFQSVAPYASYITLNISSPNTKGLRDFQHGDLLKKLITALKQEQAHFFNQQKKYVPLVVKISPDLTAEALASMAAILLEQKVDGIIATNTTIDHSNVSDLNAADEEGGVSGKPLRNRSTEVIKQLSALVQKQIPIIGCGGIFSINDANEKLAAGASLIQVYSGLVYQGPALIRQLSSMK